MRWTVLLGLLVVPLLLVTMALEPRSQVDAGVAIRMDVDQMVQHAGLVVSGRVLGERAVLADNGRIDTEYTLTIERTFWGQERGQRVIRIPGGVLPSGRGLLLPGMARLFPGEDVVLLLSDTDPEGVCVPMGLAQGKYRLLTDRAGNRMAVRTQAALELMQPGSDIALPADGTEVIAYAELVAQIETATARRRALAPNNALAPNK